MQSLRTRSGLLGFVLYLVPAIAMGAPNGVKDHYTDSVYGLMAVGIFALAYLLIMAEETIHLRKSIPVMIAAALIWVLVPIALTAQGHIAVAEQAIRANLLEYAELLLFLLAAMTYINTLQERRVFDTLCAWLVRHEFSLRTIYWITGVLSFAISPIADNLTTALIMAAVVLAVGRGQPRFIVVACINIVVAANAGGAFSPFGDITTLMVWQNRVVSFTQFFNLFVPALVNWLIPAILMFFAVPKGHPEATAERVTIKRGGIIIIGLFLSTIAMAVAFHLFLHLPPMLGMMAGLGLLKLYGYFIGMAERRELLAANGSFEPHQIFDVFVQMQRAEWDTLMFFYGVILCVGGLATLGYLELVSQTLYSGLGPTWANVLVGLFSAVIDNIPVMYAVLTMHPEMAQGQWLLVTLTAGVGGSLLAIGSAAGVGLMGQARGIYTFAAHLRWTWAIALGYVASIAVHLWLNAPLMHFATGTG